MVLDTCFCVDLMRETAQKKEGPASLALIGLENSSVYISLFSLCELRSGAALSKQPKNELAKIDKMASFLQVLYPDSNFSRVYSETVAMISRNSSPTRSSSRNSGSNGSNRSPISSMNLLIAVSAKSVGLPLITKDPALYDGIPKLKVKSY